MLVWADWSRLRCELDEQPIQQNIGLVLRVSDRVIVLERGAVALAAARDAVTERMLVPFLTP
jgi:hypothetical protein